MLFLIESLLTILGFGNLTSSIFAAVSLIGILTAGLAGISHLIYYPNGRATRILANDRLVNFLFSSTVLFATSLILGRILLFDRWKNDIFSTIASEPAINLKYVAFFNLSISLFLSVTVMTICSFLANYLEKLRISSIR